MYKVNGDANQTTNGKLGVRYEDRYDVLFMVAV